MVTASQTKKGVLTGIGVADPAGQGDWRGYYHLFKLDELKKILVEYWYGGNPGYYIRIVSGYLPNTKPAPTNDQQLQQVITQVNRDLPGRQQCNCWQMKPVASSKEQEKPTDLVDTANESISESGLERLIQVGGPFYNVREQFNSSSAGDPYTVYTWADPFCPPHCRRNRVALYSVVPCFNEGLMTGFVKISTSYVVGMMSIIVRDPASMAKVSEDVKPVITPDVIEKMFPGAEFYAFWYDNNEVTGVPGFGFWDIRKQNGERIILDPFGREMIFKKDRFLVKDSYQKQADNKILDLLGQNYPNPFNANTNISFTLPTDSRVSLKIYNIAGQLVKSFEGDYGAGSHTITWDGSNTKGQEVSSGIYFYRLVAGKYSSTKKMILMK